MIDLVTAAPYVRLHRGKIFVVKVGGACLARPPLRRALAADIAMVEAFGARVVVVHGAGPQVDAYQRSLGEEPKKVDGRRVTSPLALKALRLSTLGELNAELAAALEQAGARALGLCAGTGGILIAARRPPLVTAEGVVDFGEVGDLVAVDARAILALLDTGTMPVLSPPAGDGAGGFLNVNADAAAAHLAVALAAEKLVLVTGAPGVLTNPDDPASLVSTLSLSQLDALAERGVLREGMKVKAAAARHALLGGVPRVHVVSGIAAGALLGELYTTHGTGTLITREPETAALPPAPPRSQRVGSA
jgi:acetylglutamate kinase